MVKVGGRAGEKGWGRVGWGKRRRLECVEYTALI